jgi:dynein heavy chain 1
MTDGWTEKILQLSQILEINHGVMLVGKSGCGKSECWKTLFQALSKIDQTEGIVSIIDPKSISKEVLYGSLDSTTREWTDGIFTKIIRNIVDDKNGNGKRRHWIVFDGDVDPEWIENLNSVLDDNKTLTLPNGERLPILDNIRLLFEVESVDKATPATVSRCGMVFFPLELIGCEMLSLSYSKRLETVGFDFEEVSNAQVMCAGVLKNLLNGIVEDLILFAQKLPQIMQFSHVQALQNLFSLLTSTVKEVIEYDISHEDFPIQYEKLKVFLENRFWISLAWSLGGNLTQKSRLQLGDYINKMAGLNLDGNIFDYDMNINDNDFILWQSSVPRITMDPSSINRHDVVIPTVDTLRHEKIISQWLTEHRPVILCGPPGSGVFD